MPISQTGITFASSAANPSIKAVVLRVNSPGGVVAPTQEIFAAIQRARKAGKPVVASLGAVAASGGYYIAMPAQVDQQYVVAGAVQLSGDGANAQLVAVQPPDLSPVLH